MTITEACQNPECIDYQNEETRNLIRWGKNRAGYQKYFCKSCKHVFVETKNTHLFNRRMRHYHLNLIAMCLSRKKSFREIGRIVGHHPDTIRGISNTMLIDPKKTEYILFHQLTTEKTSIDDIWDTIRGNRDKARTG